MLSKATAEPGLAAQRDTEGGLVVVDGAPVLVHSTTRWIGSGRTFFDNKGNPVKAYEPYFSSTDGYEDEAELREQGVTPLLHYDPLGRLVRTELPDGTSTAVQFSPWRQTTWDQNDRVSESEWEAERASLAVSDPRRRALEVTLEHAETPSVVHLDFMGRAVRSLAHNVVDGAAVMYETRTVLDVVGNVLEVRDARGNVAEARTFGLAGQALRVTSEDAGTTRSIANIVGVPLRGYSARGMASRGEYDALWRPTHGYVREGGGAEQLVMRTVYGESLSEPAALNHRGQVYAVYDSAGVAVATEFDFKGNALGQTRRLTAEFRHTPDWSALAVATGAAAVEAAAEPLLEAETFAGETTYDGLSRPQTQTTPDGSVTELRYNDAGMLDSVAVAVRGAGEVDVCVSNIEYDEKGRRELIAYGNGTETRYTYDDRTYRLQRLRTTRVGEV